MHQADLEKIIGEADCSPYEFKINPIMGSGWYSIQATTVRVDAFGNLNTIGGPVAVLTPDMTRDQMIRQAFRAAEMMALSEVRASFLWRGKPVFSGVKLDSVWLTL